MSTWPAPTAAGPVRARVVLPASKSITNRALVLAALSDGPSVIENPLIARDSRLAAAALRQLGAGIQTGPTSWGISPGRPASPAITADVGNSGTVMRFLPAVAALTRSAVTFTGDARASERPVGPVLGALRQLGADIEGDAVPFLVRGHGEVRGGSVELDASGSSQFVSGLLLGAPRFTNGITVRHNGPAFPSLPHITMTLRMLKAAGARVTASYGRDGTIVTDWAGGRPDTWRVEAGTIDLGIVRVEPDLSNAGPFLAAAVVTGGTVTIPGWPADSLQAADEILGVLGRMGAAHEVADGGLTISGTGTIRGITADLRDVSELALVLTAVAALADGPSEFTGLAHIRGHETDRLAAIAKEINALGGDVTELPDGLRINPRPLTAGAQPFGTYDDHRLVMAAAVLGLAVPGLLVGNPETVGKTFPGFTPTWTTMVEGSH
jgi:3-phosphoshikimate 1-carboxyvinyltransferase